MPVDVFRCNFCDKMVEADTATMKAQVKANGTCAVCGKDLGLVRAVPYVPPEDVPRAPAQQNVVTTQGQIPGTSNPPSA